MKLEIIVTDPLWKNLPKLKSLARRAVQAALPPLRCEINLCFASDAEVQALNQHWRGKNTPTNILSFPTSPHIKIPKDVAQPLGDMILAYGIVAAEATAQNKPLAHHVMHLLVHGTLHLQGFDHETVAEAEVMEQKEIAILAALNIANPYADDDDDVR